MRSPGVHPSDRAAPLLPLADRSLPHLQLQTTSLGKNHPTGRGAGTEEKRRKAGKDAG